MRKELNAKAIVAGVIKYFDITLPTTRGDLKKAYRKASLTFHPDRNPGNPDAEEQFKEMQSVYDTLLEFSAMFFSQEDSVEISILTTLDGTPLTDLGKGLGITKNGCDCDHCNHKGYRPLNELQIVQCSECDENGQILKTYPCKACNGSGQFVQERSGRTVPCRKCGGSGKFHHPYHKKACPACYGEKIKNVYVESKTRFVKCGSCDGAGEIPIFNPVLRKGVLTTLKKNLQSN